MAVCWCPFPLCRCAGTMRKSLCGCGVFVGPSEQAKRVKKCVFTPCVYVPFTWNLKENSIKDKMGIFESAQNNYPIPMVHQRCPVS